MTQKIIVQLFENWHQWDRLAKGNLMQIYEKFDAKDWNKMVKAETGNNYASRYQAYTPKQL